MFYAYALKVIMIEVRLFATFREGRDKILFLEPHDYKSVDDILKKLNINAEDVAICLVNGFHQKTDVMINDEDIIALFPPVGGG